MLTSRYIHAGLIITLLLSGCGRSADPLIPANPAVGTPSALALQAGADGATLLAGFHVQVDPETLMATVTPHRATAAQPPQGQRYDLDIANFQNANSFRITGVQVLGSGNFRLTFSHAHPFPAPNVTNPATGTNRADLGYTGRLLVLTTYNPKSFFTNAVRLSAGAVVGPDGYVEVGDLLASSGIPLVTAYPYKLLADEAQDNREGVSNGGVPAGNYAAPAGGWQRINLGANGTGWTGYDYLHGGQSITNQITLSRESLNANNFALDVALLIQYTDPRGSGGATHRLPPEVINASAFAYRLPYAALDVSRVIPTSNLTLRSAVGSTTTLEVRVRDWDAGASEASGKQVGGETDVARIQQGGAGAPEVVLDCPDLLTAGLRNLGTPTSGTGLSNAVFVYSNTLPNQTGAGAGTYYGCLRVTDVEFADTERGTYHAGVDATTLLPSASRAVPARTWQIVPITVNAPPVVTGVTPTGIVGAVDEKLTFQVTATGTPTSFDWNFGGGTREPTATGPAPEVYLGGLPGTFTGSVTATNADGTSAPYPFTYRVLDPQRPDFTWHRVNFANLGLTFPDGQHVFVVDGRPILIYSELVGGSGDRPLRVSVSQVPLPTTAGDWFLHDVIPDGVWHTTAAMVDDRLAFIASVDDGGGIMPFYGRANVPIPGFAGNWVVTPMQAPEPGQEYAAPAKLLSLNGLPYAFVRRAANGYLYAYNTTTTTPTGSGDWIRSYLEDNIVCFDATVQTMGAEERVYLVLSDTSATQIWLSKVAKPQGDTDFNTYSVYPEISNSVALTGRTVGNRVQLYMVERRSMEPYPQMRHLEVFDPGVPVFGRAYYMPVEADGDSLFPVTMVMHNNRPILQYMPSITSGDGPAVIFRARRPDPFLADWEMGHPGPNGDLFRFSFASLDNRIAYFASSNGMNEGLVFGYSDGPW